MAEYTSRYQLMKLGQGDALSDDSYKFTSADRELMDLLLWYGVEGHHHNGGGATSTNAPEEAPVVQLVSSSGNLPAGKRVFYKYTYVDVLGSETGPSPEVFVDTPAQVSAPSKPTLVGANTGGTLAPGGYYYVLSAYTTTSIYETPALNPEFVLVSSTTATNAITLTLPTLPSGASGFNVYRQAPGGPGYFFITSIDMTAATPPSQWVDTGGTPPNCDRTRPTVNTTVQTNSVILTLPGATPALAPGQSWRIYRTMNVGDYTNSLLATVTEANYTDTGSPTSFGQPPTTGVSVGAPERIQLTNTLEVQGRLPLSSVSAFPETITFAMDGDTFALTGTNVWVCEYPQATILGVRASLGRGYTPTTQDVIIDVNKGSGTNPSMTTIFTNQGNRPRIMVGDQIGVRMAPDVIELVEGDVITIDIDQADTGSTDQDLSVNIFILAYGFTSTTSHPWATP